MKRMTMLFAFWLFALMAMAQKEEPLYPNTLEKVEEGRLLALLDDIYVLAYPHLINTPQFVDPKMLFFPYIDGDTGRLIIYNRTLHPKVTYSVSIANFNTKFPVIETNAQVRDFTSTEWELYSMIETSIMEHLKDTFITGTPNTYPKFRPIITPNAHKFYYYLDPIDHDSLIFGNDYVFNFDQHNKFVSKKSLHQNVSYYAIKDKSLPDTILGYHCHTDEDDDDYTATDICKVIYYHNIAGWNNFVVEGKHFVTFWDYKKNKLIRYDAREFIKYYANKPYRGRQMITHVDEEKEDSGHIPLTTQMEQIVEDGMYLTNLNIVNTVARRFAAKNAEFAKQNLHALSYLDGHTAKTVFFKEENSRKASATVSYDERYDTNHVKVDFQTRKFTANEARLYDMYATALKAIQDNHLMEAHKTVTFIIQPVISGSSKKVYVSTESFDPEKLAFGNDFYIEFDKNKDNYLKIVELHSTSEYLRLAYNGTVNNLLGIHSHTGEADDFLTATDVSKILTYQLSGGWSHFVVRGKKHFCFWDLEKNKAIYWDDQTFKTLYTDKPYRGKMILKQADFFRR